MLYRIDLALALVLAGGAALWGLPRVTVKRALAGLVIGLVPYLVHVVLAGPGTVWRGMLVDPIFHLRAGRSLPIPPNPDHLEGIAKVIVLFDRSWPLPRLSIPQQLFAWFVLLVLLAVALVALGAWLVRRAPARVPAACVADRRALRAGHVPAGVATCRLRASRVGERSDHRPPARRDRRARDRAAAGMVVPRVSGPSRACR